MLLREFTNRFQDGKLSGAIINGLALLNYIGGHAWFVDKDTYPSGVITFVTMTNDELLNSQVEGWVISKKPLMEGDYIILKTGAKELCTCVKEGDGSPYPIVTTKSQYKWSEIAMVTNIP